MASAADSAEPAVSSITYAGASIAAASIAWSNETSAIRVEDGIAGSFRWTLERADLVVNWTKERYDEVGKPTDFSKPYHARWDGETSGESRFRNATAKSASRGPESTLVVFSTNATAEVRTVPRQVSVRPAIGTSWTVANEAVELVRTLNLTPGQIEAETRSAEFVVEGDFSIYVSSANVTGSGGDTEFAYESGNWTEPIAPGPAGPNVPVRYRYYQAVRLDVRGGTLTLHAELRPVRWVAHDLNAAGNVTAVFQDVVQVVDSDHGQQARPLETFVAERARSVQTWNTTAIASSGGGLTARLEFLPGGLESTAAAIRNPQARGGVAAPASSPNGVAWILAFLGIIGIAGAMYVAKLVRSARIDDVEWAALNGRARWALILARRLVRREPRNVDAVFLLASALLARGRDDEIRESIEPLAEAIPPRERIGIAYVLAASFLRVRDLARAKKWSREASKEPAFAARLRLDHDAAYGATPHRDVDASYA